MSEHQIYEFVAVDRPLSPPEMDKLRAISKRAEISSTRFRNEYSWGDLKADPRRLLVRYFDVHLYSTHWGERRVMFRLPEERVDIAALRPYFGPLPGVLTKVGRYHVLDLTADSEDFEPGDDDEEIEDTAALVSLRVGLLQGDMRVPYLAWLLAVQDERLADTAREPPVPPGLRAPSGPLAALVDFLRIDADLLQAAAEASPAETDVPDALRGWITRLSPKEKDRWLIQSVEQPQRPLGPELLAAFRTATTADAPGSRTAGQLRARAEWLSRAAEREAQAKAARRAKQLEAARQKRLKALARAPGGSWPKLEQLVAAKSYDDAVALAVDLHDAALQRREPTEFTMRITALKQRHSSCRGFFTRLKRQLAIRPASGRVGDRERARTRDLADPPADG